MTTQVKVSKDSINFINNTFIYDGQLYTGIIFSKYPSGNIEYEWQIESGILNGKCIGYYDEFKNTLFKKMYEYNYVNGIKIGDQFEYYQAEISLPYYANNAIQQDNRQYLQLFISKFDENFYGNLDGNKKINWNQTLGCEINTDKINNKIIHPSVKDCPTGQLHVYYEAHPSPSHLLFTKCYGSPKCFWTSFRRGNVWYFD
jgi:hypothetical protein